MNKYSYRLGQIAVSIWLFVLALILVLLNHMWNKNKIDIIFKREEADTGTDKHQEKIP